MSERNIVEKWADDIERMLVDTPSGYAREEYLTDLVGDIRNAVAMGLIPCHLTKIRDNTYNLECLLGDKFEDWKTDEGFELGKGGKVTVGIEKY